MQYYFNLSLLLIDSKRQKCLVLDFWDMKKSIKKKGNKWDSWRIGTSVMQATPLFRVLCEMSAKTPSNDLAGVWAPVDVIWIHSWDILVRRFSGSFFTQYNTVQNLWLSYLFLNLPTNFDQDRNCSLNWILYLKCSYYFAVY